MAMKDEFGWRQAGRDANRCSLPCHCCRTLETPARFHTPGVRARTVLERRILQAPGRAGHMGCLDRHFRSRLCEKHVSLVYTTAVGSFAVQWRACWVWTVIVCLGCGCGVGTLTRTAP